MRLHWFRHFVMNIKNIVLSVFKPGHVKSMAQNRSHLKLDTLGGGEGVILQMHGTQVIPSALRQ